MASQLAKAIGLRYQPVAVLMTDNKPEKALQFQKGKWGCVMFLFANAAKGKTVRCGQAVRQACW